MNRILNAAALLALLPSTAMAQSEPMRALEHMVGSWDVTTYDMVQGEWREGETTQAEMQWVLGRNGILEESSIRGPVMNFDMVVMWSWDQFREVYRQTTLDSNYGILDVYEGTLSGSTLTITNLDNGTFFRMPDGSDMAFRLELDLSDPDEHTLEVWAHIVGTEDWNHMSRVVYRRRG